MNYRTEIKKVLKRNKMTQSEFARIAGITDTTLSLLLTGKLKRIRYATQRKIEDALTKADETKIKATNNRVSNAVAAMTSARAILDNALTSITKKDKKREG